MSATCHQCDRFARDPVTKRCRSKGGVEFTVELHASCVSGYRKSLASFGSRMVDGD